MKYKSFLVATGSVLIAASVAACKHDPNSRAELADAAVEAPPVDFGKSARDLFEVNCATCHKKDGAGAAQFAILDFTALKARKTVASGRLFIDPAAPETSVILERMADQAKPMPPSGALADSDRQAVSAWIAAGAPDALPVMAPSGNDSVFSTAVDKIKLSYEQPLAIGHVVPLAGSWSPKALLEYSCAPCHSSSVKPPWYAPFDVTGTIKKDMTEAVAVWEMGNGFPFNGSTTKNQMLGDMKLLRGAFVANSMPPPIFLVAHPNAYLTSKYRSALIFWCNDVITQLSSLVP